VFRDPLVQDQMVGDATLVFWQAHAELRLVVVLGSNFVFVHTWRRKSLMRWTRAVHQASGETESLVFLQQGLLLIRRVGFGPLEFDPLVLGLDLPGTSSWSRSLHLHTSVQRCPNPFALVATPDILPARFSGQSECH
jgi:hypothetical protein